MIAVVAHALMVAGLMAREILWALILGFWLSAVIQAFISKEEMSQLLPDDSFGPHPRWAAISSVAVDGYVRGDIFPHIGH
jgi:hypothetical protein